MFAKAFIIASFCVAASLQWSQFKSCGDHTQDPHRLVIEGCTTFPCIVQTGHNKAGQWDFIATTKTSVLKPQAELAIGGLWYVPYPLGIDDGCPYLISKKQCPLEAGDQVTYFFSRAIPRVPSGVIVWARFTLKDENYNTHCCFEVEFKAA
ncbi:NPC intracellular cholesterol transporter 2 homolog a [Microplitis demolitor]|uniref:NPC intracellular cholesterol transporter 2 homolog a n=1 Tax=Microplitis demolitor TaxID=69319 RepID=UPI0004CCC079|nr:NPC intracellular cholesterol transporter 2 homolog a [Microplitis demolitor]